MTAATSNLPAGPLLGCVADDYTGGTDVASALRARRWLSDEGIGCLYFKYCSTFDSTDADLVRVLGRQTPHRVDLIPSQVVRQGPEAVAAALGGSGAVIDGLGIDRVVVAREEDVGVPWLVTADPDPLALLLKSGNFGRPDLLVRAAETS